MGSLRLASLAQGRQKKGPSAHAPCTRAFTFIPGDDLLSRLSGNTIGVQGLTTVFGMGTGVSPALWTPGNSCLDKWTLMDSRRSTMDNGLGMFVSGPESKVQCPKS